MIKNVNVTQTIDTTVLVKKTECDAKIEDNIKKIPNYAKYITTNDFNKYSGTEELKQA